MNQRNLGKKTFLSRLGSQNKDLKEFVDRITGIKNSNRRSQSSINEFHRDPYQIHDGKLRFQLMQGGVWFPRDADLDENLLDSIEPVELTDYLKEFSSELFVRDRHHDRFFSLQARCSYYGPKIHLFPDSNILISKERSRCMKRLCDEETILYDAVTIARYEALPGGLRKKFRRDIPAELFRGQQSLERRCRLVDEHQRREIQRFYDILIDYFSSEIAGIRNKCEECRGMPPDSIAEMIAKGKQADADYLHMLTKQIRHMQNGNYTNHVADRVLASLCFGFNMVDEHDKSIVVSDDSDLRYDFRMIYGEVLPRFMAFSALEAIHEQNPYALRFPGIEQRMIEAAREHIDASRANFPDTSTIGILYMPAADEFLTLDVAKAFVRYFNNVQEYREGKHEVLKAMVITGKKAEHVIHQLMEK